MKSTNVAAFEEVCLSQLAVNGPGKYVKDGPRAHIVEHGGVPTLKAFPAKAFDRLPRLDCVN